MKLLRSLASACALLGLGVAAIGGEGREGPTAREAGELFDQYCFECHGDGNKKGDLALDALLGHGKGDEDRAEWGKIWKTVRQGFMPPAGADVLPTGERRKLTHWIAQAQLGVDYAQPDPGRVTMRRLNRMEYEYTVTDLFGVDLVSEGVFSSDSATNKARLRDMLPPDDTAFGFDNIGDFQTLSPALLEKYFDLAEFVVDRVMLVDGPRIPVQSLDPAALAVKKTEESKATEHAIDFQVAHRGRYRVELQYSLGGWQEFGGGYEMTLAVDDASLLKTSYEIGGYKTYRPSGELTLEPGTHRLAFTTVPVKPAATGRLMPHELRPKLRVVGPLDTEVREYPESHRRIFFRGEAPEEPEARAAYAREIMRRVADRAFRRPASEGMVERLGELVLRGADFRRGVAQGLMAILTSPKFLFRTELQPQPDDPKSIHQLDEYALASRLSSLLWLSLPDDELRGLAARGGLRANLPAQVQRMLADPKSARFFEDFPGQWLRTRNVLMTSISKVDVKINALREAMKRETEMTFEDIARNDRDLLELVTANYSFLNKPLADFYGVEGASGEGFEKVALPAESNRGGLLTQGSFLISTSNPNRTSPVKRGLFVLETLLAIQPPPPPPSVAALDDSKANGETPHTVREQLALHRAEKSCAACHAHFDPIGVALENYNLIGQWRTEENGEPIAPDEKTITGQRLKGIADLRQMIVDRKHEYYGCVAEKLLTYALGRGMEPSDSVTVDELADRLDAGGGKFSELLLGVVESAPFQTRRGDDGASKEAPRLAVPEPPPPEKRIGRRRFGRPVLLEGLLPFPIYLPGNAPTIPKPLATPAGSP